LPASGDQLNDHFDVTRDGKHSVVARSTGSNDIILIKDFR
jgi:hypothetical protein